MADASNFYLKDLNYEINGCAFQAFTEVGVGYSELIYHKFFHEKLLEKGLKAIYKLPLQASYRGQKIVDFEADEIVEDSLVVDVKCLQTDFLPKNYAQIITYQKLLKFRLGLLINFGLHKAFSKRVLHDEHRVPNIENWDRGYFTNMPAKATLDAIVSSIKAVDEGLSPGYHSTLYETAVRIEFQQHHLKHHETVKVHIESAKVYVDPMEIDFWLVENSFLVAVLAGKDSPRKYDLFRMRSYLKRLKLKHGVIAYWSIKNLQLYGLYEP